MFVVEKAGLADEKFVKRVRRSGLKDAREFMVSESDSTGIENQYVI